MKRLLTLLPVLVFCLLCAPAVLAETVQANYLDQDGTIKTVEATVVTSSDSTWTGSTDAPGWYVVPDGDTTIGSRVTVTGDVHLILADGASLTVNGGINVGENNSLTIYAQSTSDQMGSLTAKAGSFSNAGIGGDINVNGGTVTIYGGTVTAYGGKEKTGGPGAGGAGLGGGYQGAGGTVTIRGGNVIAYGGIGNDITQGGMGGSGIGGGEKGSGGTVTITGGTVTATGGSQGAGIGRGKGNRDQGTFSTGEKGNAVILASSIGNTSNQGSWQGIIFQGDEGLVYGTDITPEEDFTIPEGKTLVIEAGKTVTIPDGVKLTNSGTIENYGTVTGTITGKALPKIDKQPKNAAVNAGQPATFSVTVTDATGHQWQQSTDNGGSWTDISEATDASYTTSTTTTAMNNYQYRCKVTGAGGFTMSSAVTLTVNTIPVTGVTLDKTSLALVVGDTATLTATVQPQDATDKTVTWSSSDDKIATVDAKGKVTAVGPGTATITATAADDSGKSASCTVTVAAKTYSLSIDPGAVGFGTMAPGYTQPAVQEVTVKNTGNQTLSLTHPTANQFEVGKLNQLTLAPGEKAVFTVRPKAGLPLGSYRETVVVKASGGVEVSVNLTFAVSDGGTGNEKCTLHFNTMGGLPLDDVVRGLGAPVELWPYTPVRAGYLFMGWYSDEALTKAVNTVVLVDDTTIYAKWAVDPAATAAQSGSGTGGSSTGSGSGSGSKATPAPTPTATPAPTPTATPAPAPTATPESTPEVTPAPEETPEKGGFPVFPVAAGGIILVAAAGVFFLLNRRR